MSSLPPAVAVKNIHKHFGPIHAVQGVSMQIPRGEIRGFLGPNGSGKTTFMRILCGLLTPDEGEGSCLGYNIRKDADEIKYHVGYMTQRFSLYEDLSIEENLDFMARMFSIPHRHKAVEDSLQRLGLTARRRQLAGTLSGGWKQRLALAACLIHQPELLLLDEPTAGVDPKARKEFWDEIHTLSDSGLTILVSTHYMDEAERCHSLAYIAQGKLLVSGTQEMIISQAGLTTYQVRGARLQELKAMLERLTAIEQVVSFGTSLHVSGKDREAFLHAVAPFKQSPYLWQEVETGLEDIFINLMSNTREFDAV